MSILSRSSGGSAVASASYRHATQMMDRDQERRDYSDKRDELVHSEVAVPEAAADWVGQAYGQVGFDAALQEVRAEAAAEGRQLSDFEAERAAWARVSERLWTSVEDHEARFNKRWKQAQLARAVTVALPNVLDRVAQIELMRGFVEAQFTSRGMVADWVIHDKGDGNPHAHVMVTLRTLEEAGWGLKNRSWNATSALRSQRKTWADHANLMLEREGFAERIDHRSLRAQGLDLEPEGYSVHVSDRAGRAGEAAREQLRCAELRRRNRAYLRAHPDHILAVVQASRAVFGESHIRAAFAKRLGLDLAEVGGELDRLVQAAMAAPDLVDVIGQEGARGETGERLYITAAKARMAQRLARDAAALAGSRLELVPAQGPTLGDVAQRQLDILADILEKEKGDGVSVRHDGAGEGPGAVARVEPSGAAGDGASDEKHVADIGNGVGEEYEPEGASRFAQTGAGRRGGTSTQERGKAARGAGLSAHPVADAIEHGSGPIVIDLERWKEAGHDDRRGDAAAAGGDAGAGRGDGGGPGGPAPDDGSPGGVAPAAAAGGAFGKGPSAAAVREALEQRSEDLFREVFGEPVRPGAAEWRARENAGLAMRMRGPKRGLWRDYSAGEGGDLLDLVARAFCGLGSAREDFPRVLEEAARYCGLATDRPVDMTALAVRSAQRARDARIAEQKDAARRAALVKALAGRAVPVEGTAAGAYLASRGITALPGDAVAYVPPVPGVGVLSPEHAALVVWAKNDAGEITGGQRILVTPDGSKVETDAGTPTAVVGTPTAIVGTPTAVVRKPSFGAIGGSVARFAAREGLEDGPLVIAEGPESALSIWQSTGFETWAVFGVSGFKSAPAPLDREVILAPDRDAPDSPAGRAFRKAVAHHLARIEGAGQGGRLSIAVAPEPVGSKQDLNDTLMREDGGADAVRAAIAGARAVKACLSPGLNAGQRAAAEAMLDAARLTLVTGHAGVGKTFTIREAARAWQDRGVPVLAGAPSGKATQELAGIDGVEAATLSAWEARWARGDLPAGAGGVSDGGAGFVFFMDEAGMVGLGQWARLQRRIAALGGKLIAVGDPEQLQPVNDLSGWAVAEGQVRASGATVPVMDLVIRQRRKGDRAATGHLAGGDAAGIRAGLLHYVQTGALRLEANVLADPVSAIAAAYFEAEVETETGTGTEMEAGEAGLDIAPHERGQEGQGAVLDRGVRSGPVPGRALAHYQAGPGRIALGYTNRDVAALNAAIRGEAQSRGLIDQSAEQTFGIERIDQTVKEGAPGSIRHRVTIDLAPGDRILLTRAHRDLDLPRAGFGTVLSVSQTGLKVLMDGRQEAVEIDAGAFPHFDYGYAATVHKSQGMTEDRVLVLPHRLMDRHAMNVALSRHRESVRVFGRKGHCDSVQAFCRLGLQRGAVYSAPATGDRLSSMVAMPEDAAILMRKDWRGPGRDVSRHRSFTSDRHLMDVLTRVSGLLSADHADTDPLRAQEVEDGEGYIARPQRVIDDLIGQQGVVNADEVAGVFARLVSDPETFQRLFREAMSHPDLVALPGAGGAEPWVYTTEGLLKAELAAVDRGLRLALRGLDRAVSQGSGSQGSELRGSELRGSELQGSGDGDPGRLPVRMPEDVPALTADQHGAVISTLAPGDLKIIRGGTGAGKTRVAAAVARAHEARGAVVTVISPTRAGLRALAAEGVPARSLAAFFAEPVTAPVPGAPERVVILDDAHGLGAGLNAGGGRADVVLARIEMMGAKLVALVNPDRRPAEAGAVFTTLANRMTASDRMSASNRMSASPHMDVADLTGLHGVDSPGLQVLGQGLRPTFGCSGAREGCSQALQRAQKDGIIQARGDRERAIAALARAYVADRSPDKLALAWSRAERQALTDAIRARLDQIDGARAAFGAAEHGVLKGLRPGDRIRFTSSGVFGAPAEGRVEAATAVGVQSARLRRGDLAEVLGPGVQGGLRLRVTGGPENAGAVREISTREITVAAEGPLPRWQFAFASTIMATAGHRHDSIHLLGRSGMDRAVLSAGVLAARRALRVFMPVRQDRLGDVMGRIASRVRAPRSALDYGFDPTQAARAAQDGHSPDLARLARACIVEAPAPLSDPDEASPDEVRLEATGLDEVEITRLTQIPKLSLTARQLQAANTEFLKAHPDQILATLQTDRPVFTESDVLRGLRDRLGGVMGEGEIQALGAQVMGSEDLVRLGARAPDGAVQYMTRGRAAVMRQCEVDAQRLATGVFEAGQMQVLRPDALAELNPGQRAAADAMLGAERLTLVQGHAGVGKTFTLGKVAQGWQARGVTVLAGAPSGKATDELAAALKGVRTRTLAGWEAAWARGEVPRQGKFVFVMDEAGMVGVGQWARLQRQVAAMGGKLIAVGDPDQFQPVSDLPGWSIAEQAVGHSTVMDTVLRQSALMDREATEALARGGEGVGAALRYYMEKGALKLGPEVRADPVGAIAREYWRRPARDSRIALAATNRDVARLNDAIRGEALARGAQEGRQGDTQGDTQGDIDPATVRHYGTITRVFAGVEGRKERVVVPLELGVGERIMLTQAHRDPDLPRSALGTVIATREAEIDVQFDGRTGPVTLDLDAFRGLDYGYAATVHKAQGMGADHVHVLPHRWMHRHAIYVALSRHKESLTIYGRAGHAERLSDLIAMGQAAGHLDMVPEDSRLAERPAGGLVPGAASPVDPYQAHPDTAPNAGTDGLGLSGRADWQAMGSPLTRTGFAGDADLMAVAERHVGLLAARYRKGDPVLTPDHEDRRGYARFPRRVVDDLVARQSVLRAEDVASHLTRFVQEPETFLRLYRAAMTHPDLVMLSQGGSATAGAGGKTRTGARVYTTRAQLKLELNTVDLGGRLALSALPKRAPEIRFAEPGRSDAVQRGEEMPYRHKDALYYAAAPRRLRIIRGQSGSGKRVVAAQTARMHADAGWQVLSVSPTGAGLEALEREGVKAPRSLRRFMAETGAQDAGGEKVKMPPRVQLDPGTVVVLSDAGRVGAAEMGALLRRIETSGAKLVAFMGGEEEMPMEAGAVARALEMRAGSAWLGRDRARDAGNMIVVSGLLQGGAHAEPALGFLQRTGALLAGGTARRAIDVLADSYVSDPAPDRIALTWSRADAQAATRAIRSRLDHVDPARAALAADAPLKPGDRIRFMAGTPWVPPAARGARWAADRIHAGERGEVLGPDPETGELALRLTARDGVTTRDIGLCEKTRLPDWDYAFAGTIHGEGARVRDHVHLLVSPGMSRQVLAAGAAAHLEKLRLVVPSSEAGMEDMLNRILQREGRAESVLDYGFDPALGAREAMRGRSVESDAGAASGLEAAITRLARLAGIDRAAPVAALDPGLEREVLAEVIGAAILRAGQAPDGTHRLALERYTQALTAPRDWRRILRQVPADLPARADDLAASSAGRDGAGRLLPASRLLARGALAARWFGEEDVATLFEDGLTLYGQRAETARVHGRAEELVREPGQERPAPVYPDPSNRPQKPQQRARSVRPRRRSRSAFNQIMAGVQASDEQVARMALEIWGISDRPRRRARIKAYAQGAAARRAEMKVRGIKPQVDATVDAVAVLDKPVARTAARSKGRSKTVDYAALAAEQFEGLRVTAERIGKKLPMDLETRLPRLMEQVDAKDGAPGQSGQRSSDELMVRIAASKSDLVAGNLLLARLVEAVVADTTEAEGQEGVTKDTVAAGADYIALAAEQFEGLRVTAERIGKKLPMDLETRLPRLMEQVDAKDGAPGQPGQRSSDELMVRIAASKSDLVAGNLLLARLVEAVVADTTEAEGQEGVKKDTVAAEGQKQIAEPIKTLDADRSAEKVAPAKVPEMEEGTRVPERLWRQVEIPGNSDHSMRARQEEQQALVLRMAVQITRIIPRDDPIHKRDLVCDLRDLLVTGDLTGIHREQRVSSDKSISRFLAADDSYELRKPTKQREFLDELKRHAVALSSPLPDHDELVRERKGILDALVVPDRSARPSRALIARMGEVFTQSEVFALTVASEALPDSLANLGDGARIRISDYLTAEVAARKVEQHRKEQAMNQRNQPETRSTEKIRDDVLNALEMSAVDEDTVKDMLKTFTRAEIRALNDPSRALPETLSDLTQDERQHIAATLAAWRSQTNQQANKGGGGQRPAPFVPDKEYDGRALQLACAITERVDAHDDVHKRDLVLDIRELLRTADQMADKLPQDKVAERARALMTARVTLDAKLALAAKLDGEKFNQPLFLRNIGPRNPDPGYHHPLGHAPVPLMEEYDRDAPKWVERALDHNPQPTQAEISVARIASLPNLPDGQARLVAVLQDVFRDGSIRSVDVLMQERETLLAEIANTKSRPEQSEPVLWRMFSTFTHKEVLALAQPGRKLPPMAPALDEARRHEIAQGITTILSKSPGAHQLYAWGPAAKVLEFGLHPERAARARSRGMGMSM
ncbi:AAA family ATPase [Ruegeria sp.]|uniref:AAA family ATPase n=1 Tax=Ruegeria sp. TaxID=1879320 RepID=UPI003B0011F5